MKKTLRMKFMLLLFALVVGSLNVFADEGDEITSIANIVDGKSYYIKGVRSSTTYYLTFNDATGSQSGTESSNTSGAQLITFHLVSQGVYTLETSNGYYIAPGTSNGKINVSSSSINVTASNQSSKIRLSITSGDNTWSIQKNTSAANFGGYKNTQSDITLIEGPSAAYTVTAQSNNDTYGSVAVSGTTITATPNSGYRVIAGTGGYTVTDGSATVTNNGDNTFTVSPTTNCTVQINFEAIPTHTATFSVNGNTSQTASVAEDAAITFPSDPANISGRKFVGWVTEAIAEPTDVAPSFVNTASTTMGSNDVTFYAVFAIATPSGYPVETKTQTLQYDTWTYGGTTSNQNNYRLFGNTGYVQSSAFDLSKLSKVIVYGGTYGGNSYNSLTIGDGTNTWKSVTVSGSSNTGENIYTEGSSLIGTKALYVTSNSGNANGSGVRMTKVEIYTMEPSYTYSGYSTSVEVYTITAVSNNTEYGTVLLSDMVITGSPKAGCRYASPAYTVTVGTATVSQSGNDFTVTPTSSCTVRINFEAIPTHTITVTGTGGTVTVKDGDDTIESGSSVREGTVLTINAVAGVGKVFLGWDLTGATPADEYEATTTFTMGTSNVTIEALYEDATTHAITYSVNGNTNTVNVVDGLSVDLSAPSSALIPVGYVFKGWRTSELVLTDTDPNDYVTSATSEGDITYYAVMAMDNVNYVTTHLTGEEIATNFAATAMGYADSEKTYNDTGESMTWGARCITNATRHWIQLKSDNDVYIKAVAPENITEVKVTISNATNTSGGVDDITKHGDFSGNVNLDKVQNTNAGACGTAASSAIVNRILTISADGTSNTIYIHVTAAARVWNVDVTYASINANNFCTSVSSVALTEDVTIAGDLNVTYTLTVPTGKTLTVNGTLTNNNPAHLIIEDGGQLVTTNSVKATMKKSTVASTATKATNKWYLISSPVSDIEISAFVPAEQTDDKKWDVYRYDEPTRYWNEYRSTDLAYPSFSTLTSGVGYLYRSTIPGIEFQGDVNVSPATYKLKYTDNGDDMNGFNLIGNPFSYNIYKGVEIPNDDLEPNFYVLEANGGWTLSYDHGTSDPAGPTEIKPNTAILVQAISTANDKNLTISKSSKGGDYKYGNDQISFRIENSEYSDVACVLFREGHGLNKISHRNAEIPMLYVTKEGENFASANMPDNTSVINLGFEAKTIGQYTFSLKAEGQYSYMHLYDKLTGNDVDMLVEDSYTFIGAPSDRKDRFVLNLNYNAGNIDTESDIFAYQSGNDIMVSGEGELQVFDVMGRMVMSQRINGVETVNGLNNGVYIFRLEEKTQKIVVR